VRYKFPSISSKDDSISNGECFKNDTFSRCQYAGRESAGPEQLSKSYGILLGTYGNIVMVLCMEKSAQYCPTRLTKELRNFELIQIE
jgi:hypothetical protein